MARNFARRGTCVSAVLFVAAVALMFLAGLAYASLVGAVAGADEPATVTVAWQTGSDPAGPLPTDASDTTWPQTYVGTLPECAPVAYVAQVDTYRYGTDQDKATVDALVAAGVLQQPGQSGSDSSVVISWRYVVVPACVVESSAPPSSSAPAPTVTPTVSASCTTAPGTTVDCHPSRVPLPTPSGHPTLPKSTSSAVVVVARSSTGTALMAHKAAATPVLANTGARWLPLTIIGATLLAAGGMMSVAGRNRAAR